MGDTTGNELGSSSSSSDEADNTEDDEDYVPDPSDLGGDPDGVEVKFNSIPVLGINPQLNPPGHYIEMPTLRKQITSKQ